MWQHSYLVQALRMEELREAAERERRWRLQDEANGRQAASDGPGRARTRAARVAAATSRLAARVAHRLDARLAVHPGAEPLLRDAWAGRDPAAGPAGSPAQR
jgi:hypothetical protein